MVGFAEMMCYDMTGKIDRAIHSSHGWRSIYVSGLMIDMAANCLMMVNVFALSGGSSS